MTVRHRGSGKIIVALCLAASLTALWISEAAAQAYARDALYFAKRFNLYGSLELSYDGNWYSGDITGPTYVATFSQFYNLGLTGFVIDPRLVNFDVSANFTDASVKNGTGYDLMGESLRVNLLEKLPPRLLKSWMFIPHPITLRFQHYSGVYNFTNYGLTLRHAMPEEIKAQILSENPGTTIKFPTTFFDYDHYEYSGTDTNTVSDLYSARSFFSGKHYDYQVLFDKINQTGTPVYKQTTLEVDPNYHFYNEDTQRSLDIYNVLRYQKINEQTQYFVNSLTNWRKPYGKDLLLVTGQLFYNRFSTDNENVTNSFAVVNSTYERVVSPRLTLRPGVTLLAGKSGDQDIYVARGIGGVTYEISRVFRTKSSVFAGVNENGTEYGIDAYLYTKTPILVSLGYVYNSLTPVEGGEKTQQVLLDASGPITGNLNFTANAQYLLRESQNSVDPSTDKGYTVSGSLYWNVLDTSVAVGATWTKATREAIISTTGTLTSFQANIGRFLAKRLFFNLYGTWQKDDLNGQTQIDIRPRLSWSTTVTFIDLEYNYLNSDNKPLIGNPSQTTTHRVFLRFVRRLSRDFFIR